MWRYLPRIGMQTQQAKHSIPTAKQSRPLFGSGIEKTLPYTLSNDFVSLAEQDGKIEKIDNENELAIIKYKDGSSDSIDISERISKNSNGGWSILPTLNLSNCWKTLKHDKLQSNLKRYAWIVIER